MFESNPILTRTTERSSHRGTVTFDGIIHRTGILVLVTIAAFAVSWIGTGGGLGGIAPEAVMTFSVAASVGATILGLYLIFAQSCNPYLIGTYAAGQGLLLGCVSRAAEARFPGIAAETAIATFGIFLLVLGAYRLRLIRATPLLLKIVVVGTIGVAGLYLCSMVGGFFGHPLGIVQGNGNISILISCGIVVLASINFVLDFARAEGAVAAGASEEYSWQIAFGLLIGLVWLYIEILRLLTKLRSRD